MSITNIDLQHIFRADLEALRENQVAEGILIDYKRDVYGDTDHDKREFLKDVSSFANTAGGHIIIGMDVKGGLPTNLVGVEGSLDAEVLATGKSASGPHRTADCRIRDETRSGVWRPKCTPD